MNHQVLVVRRLQPPASSLGPKHSSLEPPASSLRSGLTLFELLLVLTLLVILGGLSITALEGSFARSRLRHAGDQVRAAWATARLTSLETGQTHAFRCVWGSGQYHIQALGVLVPTADGQLTQLPDVAITPDSEFADARWVENRLTGGVTFSDGQWVSTAKAYEVAPPELALVDRDNWSEPIYFFPDGTTTDARLILENAEGDRLLLTLRGLTGISLASDPDLEEEMQ